MERIFLSYHFDDNSKILVDYVKRIINSHDIEVIDGKRLAGNQLTQGVKNEIEKADAMIILLTNREEGKTNNWVQHERTTAFNSKIPFIAVIEEGVPNNGPFENFEYIIFESESILETIVCLSETIFEWKNSLGVQIEAFIEPDSIANVIRENMDYKSVVEYRFFDYKNGLQDKWHKPIIKPNQGGLSLLLSGIKKNSEFEIKVTEKNSVYKSGIVKNNLRILLK